MPEDLERILQGCFHPKEGRPNLQKVPVNLERAQQHIDKAHNNLRAMKLMFDNDLFDWTIICGYSWQLWHRKNKGYDVYQLLCFRRRLSTDQ